ncbi:MAG: flippase-like domain-containing protein [Anaerolineaceae bacterium]|nr:flippase-like domain-containing protein [Anaerolineaceae bacterium]
MQKQAARKYISPLNILFFGIGLLLLIFLLSQVDFQNLARFIANIQPIYLLLGGLIYLIKSAIRALRFWRINAEAHPSFLKMLRLTLASSLASQLMPLKLGELTYIYLVKKDIGSPISQGISSLIIIRIFDLLAISILFILAALGFGMPTGLSVYFSYVLGFITFLVIILASLVGAGKFFSPIVNTLVQKTFLGKIPLIGKAQDGLERILAGLGKFNRKETVELVIYPLLEWSVNFAMYHVLLEGMGLSPRPLDTIIGVTFAALASVLPVNSFGNFGTQEAGWATGLILSGFTQQTALASGFATHLLSLGYMLVMGGAA